MTAAQTKKPEKTVLQGDKRTIVGKKVKNLREEGILPANVFGSDITSIAIQIPIVEFIKVFKVAGETQVVYISVEKDELPTLIRNVQLHPVSGEPLHADFQKINLKQKVTAEVPVHFIGESEPVNKHEGDLLTLISTLEVEALPSSVPQAIEVDISILKAVDDMVKVSDLKTSSEYTILSEPETPIVKVAAKQEEVVAEASEETQEGETAGEQPSEKSTEEAAAEEGSTSKE